MRERAYRFSVSPEIDQDIIQFLESVPAPRRAELLRHILRFYQSQLKSNEEYFLPYVQKHWGGYSEDEKIQVTDYKVRMNTAIDGSLIELIDSVPRKRRSDFWRHAIRFYMSHLEDDEYFIMPKEISDKKQRKPKAEKKKINKETPPESLFEFSF